MKRGPKWPPSSMGESMAANPRTAYDNDLEYSRDPAGNIMAGPPSSKGGGSMAASTVPAAATAAPAAAAAGGGSPVVAMAGLSAAAGLFQTLMKMQAEKEAQQREYAIQKQRDAQQRLNQTQDNQISIAQRMGTNEQNALQNLMAAISRTVR